MIIDTKEVANAMRVAGLDDVATAIERGEVALAQACDIVKRNGAAQAALARASAQFPPGATGGDDACQTMEELIVHQFVSQCGLCPEPCLLRYMVFATMLSSFAETRDDFSIPDLALLPAGVAPTGGVPSNGQGTTTFVNTFPILPGQSILMRTQQYALPYNPRCLWGVLPFSGGTAEENYLHVLVKIWVGPKTLPAAFGLLDGTLTEWNPHRWIYGSEFRCGTKCQEVALRGYTGCGDADIVGINSQLYIQIDNLGTASFNITGQQMVLKLGGFKKPCCGGCMRGHECEGSCPSRH